MAPHPKQISGFWMRQMLFKSAPHVCAPGKHAHVFNPSTAPIVHVIAIRHKNGVIGAVGGDSGYAVVPEAIDNPPVDSRITPGS